MIYPDCIDRIGIEFEGIYTDLAIETAKQLKRKGLLSNMSRDGSVRIENDTESACSELEITTTPLLATNLDKILTVFTTLQENREYFINRTCGLHFHVSLKNTGFGFVCKNDFYQDVIKLFKSKYKKVYDDRKNNRYCEVKLDKDSNDFTDHFKHGSHNRYHAVNFSQEPIERDENELTERVEPQVSYDSRRRIFLNELEYRTDQERIRSIPRHIDTVEVRLYGGRYGTIRELKSVIQDTINLMQIHVMKQSEVVIPKIEIEEEKQALICELNEKLEKVSLSFNERLIRPQNQDFIFRNQRIKSKEEIIIKNKQRVPQFINY